MRPILPEKKLTSSPDEPALRDAVESAAARILQNPRDPKEIASYGADMAEELVQFGLEACSLCNRRHKLNAWDLNEEGLRLQNSAEDATDSLVLYMRALAEITRRYDEDFIPAAREKCAAGGTPADEAALASLVKRHAQVAGRFQFLFDVSQATFKASEKLARACQHPGDPVDGLEDLAAQLRGLTRAEQERKATEEAVEAATRLDQKMNIGAPLKFKPKAP